MAKVLLVEDDNNLREIYEARLQAEGYSIVSAKDGEEALVVAKEERPDLIISDVMMPKISGFEMLDILRNTEGLKDTKVIMLTALGQAEDQTRANKLGADRYLVKSQVTLEDIVKVSHELLGEDTGEVDPTAEAQTEETTDQTSTEQPVESVPVTAAPALEPTPMDQPAPTVEPISEPQVAPAPVAEPAASTPVAPAPTTTQPDLTMPQLSTPPSDQSVTTQDNGLTSQTVTPSQDDITAPQVQPEPIISTTPSQDLTVAQPASAGVDTGQSPIQAAAPASSGAIMPEPIQASGNAQPSLSFNTPEISITADGQLAQTEAEEDSAMNNKINEFLQNAAPSAPTVAEPPAPAMPPQAPVAPTEPTLSGPAAMPQPTSEQTANDQTLAQAVNDLISGNPQAEASPSPVTQPSANIQPPEPPIVPESPISVPDNDTQDKPGRKIIQPLGNNEQPKKSLDELVAQEEALEKLQANQSQNNSGVAPNNGFDPSDPNSIAL